MVLYARYMDQSEADAVKSIRRCLCVFSQLQLDTASPSLNSAPLGWGKGTSTPCSCTPVLFLLSLYPLLQWRGHWNFTKDIPKSPSLLLQISALIPTFVHPQLFSPPLFMCYLIVHIWPWLKASIESHFCSSAVCHTNICYIDVYIHQLNYAYYFSFPNQDNIVISLEFFNFWAEYIRKEWPNAHVHITLISDYYQRRETWRHVSWWADMRLERSLINQCGETVGGENISCCRQKVSKINLFVVAVSPTEYHC